MIRKYLESLGIEYKPDAVYTNKDLSNTKEIDGVEIIQDKQALEDGMNSMINTMKTMIVPYDKNLKHSNINRFHYLQYIKNNKKIENMIKMSLKTCLFLYLK